MKGLLLKDFYNLSKNIKLMLGMMILFGAAFTGIGIEISAYIVMWGMLLSMQVVTSFSFDEMTKWLPFAMTMPITRKEYIRSKFFMHLILTVCGGAVAFCIGLLSIAVQRAITVTAIEMLLALTLTSVALAIFAGGLSIPLLLKFGAERARIISILAFIVPMCIGIAIESSINLETMHWMETVILVLLYGAPILALIWEYIMYQVSCRIFMKKDLT